MTGHEGKRGHTRKDRSERKGSAEFGREISK